MKRISTYISTAERISSIDDYISEKLHINKNVKTYNYFPEDKDELIECIMQKVDKYGLGTKNKPLYLNDIDTSKITDMSYLFCGDDIAPLKKLSNNGYFDISNWDVSNVVNMENMFAGSNFNGDISDWDVRKVKNMYAMFANSKFNNNISDWDVSNVEDMQMMFYESKFTGKKGNISKWKVEKVKCMSEMFYRCPLHKNPPKWYKS